VITRVGLAPRRPGLSFEAFQRHWRSEHADAAAAIPGLRGYVQNHAVLAEGRPLLPYPGFDACAETEFDSLASMAAGFASRQYQGRVQRDELLLIDKTRFFLLLCERRICLDAEPPVGAVKLLTFLRRHPASEPGALVDVLAGPYAEAVASARPVRHEQLVVLREARADGPPPACEAVDVLWFPTPDRALGFLTSDAAAAAGATLAGVSFGSERLLASPLVVVGPPAPPLGPA